MITERQRVVRFCIELARELVTQWRFVLRFLLAALAAVVLGYYGYEYAGGFAMPVYVCIELVLLVMRDGKRAQEWEQKWERAQEREREREREG